MAAKKTFALDSTALMLPYSISKRMPPVYRFVLTLNEEIRPAELKQAVHDLMPRFPFMYTRLRRGFIWDHLEEAPDCDIVEEDDGQLCRPFDYRGEKPLFRVLYRNNDLMVELTHFTNDGCSATVYICSLAARYLELRGHAIEKNHFALDCHDEPTQSELADAFLDAYEKPKKKIRQISPPAFQGPGKRLDNCLRATVAEIPVDAMKALLKQKYGGCTITEYLTAVYAFAFLQLYEAGDKRKPVRLQVPANLRHFFESDSLRNFSAVSNIPVLPQQESYGFEDVLEVVAREMKEKLTRERMQAFVYQNVRYLKILNFVPGFLKRLALILLALVAERVWPFSSGITNIGYIPLPPSLAQHVRRYAIILGRFGVNRTICAATGVNNTMAVAFSAANETTNIQDFCIRFWKRDGLPVRVTDGAESTTQEEHSYAK